MQDAATYQEFFIGHRLNEGQTDKPVSGSEGSTSVFPGLAGYLQYSLRQPTEPLRYSLTELSWV